MLGWTFFCAAMPKVGCQVFSGEVRGAVVAAVAADRLWRHLQELVIGLLCRDASTRVPAGASPGTA